jgi:hypothetical protein
MPLDPTPSTPPPVAPAVVSDVPPLAATDQPAFVPIPQDQLQSLMASQTRLAQLEAEARQREEAAQAEAARLLAAKGQVEEALKTIQQQSEAKLRAEAEARLRTEERAKRYALDNELAKALSMHPLLPGTTDQLTAILRSQLQVEAQGDSYVVRTPAFVSAIDHVAATLGKPEFAHFLRPHGAGGAGAGGANAAPTPPANPTPAPQPKNFGEAIILQMQELAKSTAVADPKTDMTKSFGLGRVKQA